MTQPNGVADFRRASAAQAQTESNRSAESAALHALSVQIEKLQSEVVSLREQNARDAILLASPKLNAEPPPPLRDVILQTPEAKLNLPSDAFDVFHKAILDGFEMIASEFREAIKAIKIEVKVQPTPIENVNRFEATIPSLPTPVVEAGDIHVEVPQIAAPDLTELRSLIGALIDQMKARRVIEYERDRNGEMRPVRVVPEK